MSAPLGSVAPLADTSTHVASGAHLIADLYGIAEPRLRDAAALKELLERAAHAARATVLFSHFHTFGEGGGITGVVLLAESHITLHTWPEHGFAAVDIFMCGQADPALALETIKSGLAVTGSNQRVVPRGS